MPTHRLVVAFIGILTLIGCGSRAEWDAAEREAARFHALLGEDVLPIGGDPRVPEGADPRIWTEGAAKVRAANGPMRETSLHWYGTGLSAKLSANGKQTTQYMGTIYATRFDRGTGYEHFMFEVDQGQATLVYYELLPSPDWTLFARLSAP